MTGDFSPSSTNPPSDSPDSEDPWNEVLRRLQAETAGEFVILSELGRGGMSVVYLAHEIALDRRVAIKVMSPGMLLGPGMLERFRREAVTVARLSHPGIVGIHSVRHAGGLHFFVMKLIPGRSLEDVLRDGPLPVPMVQAVLFQVASALAYAHRRGVIHRDIKPGNIIFDEDAQAILTDFGISRMVAEPSQTQTGTTVGTPAYMSPEQCRSGEITAASDQYSLGVVAYEMLAGAPPFKGSTFSVLQAHVAEPPPPLRAVRPDIPEQVAQAVERMLAKTPEARFLNVLEAVHALGGGLLAEADPAREELVALVRPRNRSAAEPPTPSIPTPVPRAHRPAPPAPVDLPTAPPAGYRPKGTTLLNRVSAWLKRSTTRSPPTIEHPIPTVPSGGSEQSTSPIRTNEWRPPVSEPSPAGESTQVFAAPDAGSAEPIFPVALRVTASMNPGQIGSLVRCERFPVTIGRATGADLCFPHDGALSRMHCEIDRDESGFVIRDLSTNGLFVNGRHLRGQPVPIPFGAQIVLSQHTAVAFVADVPMLPPLSGQTLGGRYRLGELVHQSIKAATYIAEDLQVSRRVALKLFSPSLMRIGAYREEFERQAKLAAKLQHPHLCKVLDYGEIQVSLDGPPQPVSFLSTECMSGGNLQRRLESSPPDPALVGRWIQKLADALEHAHRRGVVHGDLKPACIVFDDDGTPYLTDFALARGGETAARSVLGTPDYLAPEQWDGRPSTSATDQYSIAVLAYLMVTGSLPHPGQADPAVRALNFRRGPPAAEEEARAAGRQGVSRKLSQVLTRALSVKPEDRYASVLEFSAAFTDAIANPAGRGSQPRVFMSYYRQSSSGWANYLAQGLKDKHSCSVFVDTQAQDGAPRIPDRIRNEIASCDVFVCMLSPETLTSRWVRDEIEIAFRCNKPMVPVFHEDFRPKDDPEASDSIRALLDFEAVHLLNIRNIHVEHTIGELAERVRKVLS